MDDHAEQVYRHFNPVEASIGDILIPNGWERRYANEWVKRVGKQKATVSCSKGRITVKGDIVVARDACLLLMDWVPPTTEEDGNG